MATQFITPVGRLVQGDVFAAQTKDNKGQPLIVKTGPNKGQPTQRYFVAIAVPKKITDNRPGSATQGQMVDNWEFAQWYAAIFAEGKAGYPQLFNAQGQCTHPRFAWKIADGDGVDNDGKPNSGKPGFAGHWVIKFSSSFAPKVIQNGQYINDPSAVKRGYYIRVAGNASPNIGSDVPGLYLNSEAVELVAYGEEIRTGIDAVAAFGGAGQATLPPGASMTPPTPTAMPGLPAGGMATPGAPLMQPPAMAVPQTAVMQPPAMAVPQTVPNHQFVQAAMAVPQTAVMQPQPPAAAPVYVPTPAAQGFTLDQWLASGQTIQSLVAHGMFVKQ